MSYHVVLQHVYIVNELHNSIISVFSHFFLALIRYVLILCSWKSGKPCSGYRRKTYPCRYQNPWAKLWLEDIAAMQENDTLKRLQLPQRISPRQKVSCQIRSCRFLGCPVPCVNCPVLCCQILQLSSVQSLSRI